MKPIDQYLKRPNSQLIDNLIRFLSPNHHNLNFKQKKNQSTFFSNEPE